MPLQLAPRAYFDRTDPRGSKTDLFSIFLGPGVRGHPFFRKITVLTSFNPNFDILAISGVAFVCKMPKMTLTFFSRGTSIPPTGPIMRRRWAFLNEHIPVYQSPAFFQIFRRPQKNPGNGLPKLSHPFFFFAIYGSWPNSRPPPHRYATGDPYLGGPHSNSVKKIVFFETLWDAAVQKTLLASMNESVR